MAAGDSDGVDGLLAQLIRDLAKFILLKLPEVGWGLDLVEQRGLGGNNGHAMLLNTDKRFNRGTVYRLTAFVGV
jgi:hypothetical protein